MIKPEWFKIVLMTLSTFFRHTGWVSQNGFIIVRSPNCQWQQHKIVLPLRPSNLLRPVSAIVDRRCHTNTGCRVFRVHMAPYGFLIQCLRCREAIFYFFSSLSLKYCHNMAAFIMLHLFGAHKGPYYEFQFQCLYYGWLCLFFAFWNFSTTWLLQ